VWDGSIVLAGSFGSILSWRVGSGLIWGCGWGGCVSVILRGMSVDAVEAVGGLHWRVLVSHVHAVWHVRAFLTMV